MRMWNARRLIAAGAVAAALAAGALYYRHEHPAGPLVAGDRLSGIAVDSLGGARVTIVPQARAQIINVFTTWCPPCRMEAPAFAQLASRMQMRGVDVVGIDQEEPAQAVAAFAREFGLRYPLYVDRAQVTRRVLGARMIPMTIYVDARGIIRWEHAGPLSPGDIDSLAQTAAENG